MRKFSFILLLLLSSTALLLYCSGPTEPELDNPYDQESGSYVPTPDLNTAPVEPLATAAITGGVFETDFGLPVTQKGVCWSSSETPTIEDNCTNDGDGNTTFETLIDGLEMESQYFVRAYAFHKEGVLYGGQRSFTTRDGIADISTTAATEIQTFSAIIGGEISDDGGAEITRRGLCYSTTETPTLEDICISRGSGIGSFDTIIEDLEPNVDYFVRSYARNSIGLYFGNQISFTTRDGLPVVLTSLPFDITAFSAKVGGTVTTEGEAPITGRGVCYATTENPSFDDICIRSGTGLGSFTIMLEELISDTDYFARAYAENEFGVKFGLHQTFTTQDGLPVVLTSLPFDITAFSAKVGGTITSEGEEPITGRGVCYTTSENPSSDDTCISSGSGPGSYTITLEELIPDTGYFVRAYAENAIGIKYGTIRSFSTND